MKRWTVITPKFSYTEVINEYGGPTYDTCDIVEVIAKTKTDAIKLGVVEMLKGGSAGKYWGSYSYCLDQRLDGLCPYTGVYAIPYEEE